MKNIRERMDKKYEQLITFVADRPGNDFRYAFDTTKLETELGWHTEKSFEQGIAETVEWYLKESNAVS